MSNYSNLVGLPYIDGLQDCYSCMRRYYSQVWGIELPNFARPNQFWEDPTMDLYALYKMTGFVSVEDNVFQIGDAVLMPIRTTNNSHGAVLVEDNELLHHLPNQLSSLAPLRPKWINRVTVHLRHPRVTEAQKSEQTQVHLHEVIDADVLRHPEIQDIIKKQMASRNGAVRDDSSRP